MSDMFRNDIPRPGQVAIHGRTELARHHIDQGTDPLTGQPYFGIVHGHPVEALHDWPDFGDLTARYLEAAYMVADQSGRAPCRTEALRDFLLRTFEEDGLSYRPQCLCAAHTSELFDQSRTLYALVSICMLDDDTLLRERLRGLIDALAGLTVEKDGYRFLPGKEYVNGAWTPMKPGQDLGGHYVGPLIRPLVRAAQRLDYEPALKLAADLCRFVTEKDVAIEEDGSFSHHAHSRLGTAAGLLACGQAIGREDWIERAAKARDYARRLAGPAGFVPEYVARRDESRSVQLRCETCAIMDYLDLTLLLAAHGDSAMWGEAEQILRGHLIESQCVRSDWGGRHEGRRDELSWTDRVPERMLGGYAGWSGMTQFFAQTPAYQRSWVRGEADPERYHGKRRLFQNCCAPAGHRALYLAWSQALALSGGVLEVRLLIDRSVPGAAVRIEADDARTLGLHIHTQRCHSLRVRAPAWAPRTVAVRIGNQTADIRARDGWWHLDLPGSERRVLFRIPLSEHHERYILEHQGFARETFSLRMLGDATAGVTRLGGGLSEEEQHRTSILPTAYPLYERKNGDLYRSTPEQNPKKADIDWYP